MKPIFDRLMEMEIPPDGTPDENQPDDWTLVNELETMARQSEDPIEESDYETNGATHDTSAPIAGYTEPIVTPGEVRSSASFHANSGTSLEQLLDTFGGHASLEMFLRSVATSRGYQRLGKDIRRSLMRELTRLEKTGKVVLDRLKHEITRSSEQ
jgi:hypothetical protein